MLCRGPSGTKQKTSPAGSPDPRLEPEPWQLEDAAASYLEAVAEARRQFLEGEPPWPFFARDE